MIEPTGLRPYSWKGGTCPAGELVGMVEQSPLRIGRSVLALVR